MKKRSTEEQVIRILKEAEAPGAKIREVCRRHNITEQTFFRWATTLRRAGRAGCEEA